jgi:uncharacterized protein (TIGR00369 family)
MAILRFMKGILLEMFEDAVAGTVFPWWMRGDGFAMRRTPYRKLKGCDCPRLLRDCVDRGVAEMAEDTVPEFHGGQNHCFGCGPGNAIGLRLEFSAAGDGVASQTTISSQYEGPPGYVHGGIIATLLDEAMSKANRAQGVTAMTRQMTVEYLRPVPSGSAIRIEGRVTRSEGRKHWTESRIVSADRVTMAQATGLFIAVRDSRTGQV